MYSQTLPKLYYTRVSEHRLQPFLTSQPVLLKQPVNEYSTITQKETESDS